MDKDISKIEYNNRTVYECFNNPFTYEFGSPDFNLPPMTIDDRPPPHKRACCIPDLLRSAISVASDNIVNNFTTTSDFPDILTYDDRNNLHVMNKDVFLLGRFHRG